MDGAVRIHPVSLQDADEAIAVLVAAFMQESATNYLFPESEGQREEKLRSLFDWGVCYRLECGMPVLGSWEGTRMVGVALIRSPAWRQDPPLAQAMWEKVVGIIGPNANARVDLYDAVQTQTIPIVPHAYLAAIGVRPEVQGQGFGAKLIEACIDVAEADPLAKGLALDTASEKTQAWYAKFGFRLHAIGRMESQQMRVLYRPNCGLGSPP